MRDRVSGQRLELNWYPEDSKYATKYEPGEGLDHLGVKVDDVSAKQGTCGQRICSCDYPRFVSEQSFGNVLTIHIGFVKNPDGVKLESLHLS